MHQPYACRPVLQTVQRILQRACHIADLEKPLRQLAALYLSARAPAFAVDDLLIGQHRHINRVPVHLRILAVHQISCQHIYEQGLLLAVIFRIACGKLAAPVNRKAQGFHLRAHVGDVVIGPGFGVAADGHGRVFGRHAKGIPTHRMQNVMPCRHFVAGDHVPHRVVAHMAHMDATRRIGEHLEHIVFGLVAAAACAKNLCIVPCRLPTGFDL